MSLAGIKSIERFAHHSIEFNYVEFDEILKKYEKWDA